jgi:hypothetical protein
MAGCNQIGNKDICHGGNSCQKFPPRTNPVPNKKGNQNRNQKIGPEDAASEEMMESSLSQMKHTVQQGKQQNAGKYRQGNSDHWWKIEQ